MRSRTPIDRYLGQVEACLTVDRTGRRRALEEIQGHLTDATEGLVSAGVDPIEAQRRAIAEFGPAEEVALGLSGHAVIARASTRRPRWSDWLPLVLPAVQMAVGLGILLDGLARWGTSYGASVAERAVLISCLLTAGLTVGGLVLIRSGRRTGVIWPAWIVTAFAVLLIVH